MLPDMDDAYARRVSDQLVIEVKAAMARADVRSSRALARLIGESSQYVSTRLDGGNPRTGERVPLNVRDLVAISDALGVLASELVARAESAASVGGESITFAAAASDVDIDAEVEAQQIEP